MRLIRIMHETPSRDPGDGRATGQPQGLGLARFETRGPPASGWAKRSDAGSRVVCGAKRIRSLYLPLVKERPPGLSTTSPPKGPASVSTISAATLRLYKPDLPAANDPIAAGSRSPSVAPHRARRSERRTAISAVAAGGSCTMRVKEDPPRRRRWPPPSHAPNKQVRVNDRTSRNPLVKREGVTVVQALDFLLPS